MLPGRSFTLEDVVLIPWRRRWLLLVPLALGLAAAPFAAKRIPAVYRSETLIMVIPSRVPDSYVKSTVTATVEDRLPSISDQILSRSRLERIIGDFDLYKELHARAPMEDVVARMRQDIGPVEIQRGQQSFRVSYMSQEPQMAQKVTARLASLFIDENSRDRENLAESTNIFLESQLEEAKSRLVEHEKKLEEYRRLHSGELPSQLNSNLGAIQTAQLQLQSAGESINRARERRLLVERQLVDAETQPVLPPPPVPANPQDIQLAMTAAQQLEAAEKALDVLKLRYTADHPDVRKMERTIRDLRERVAQEAARPAPPPPPPSATQSPAEQARQRRIRDAQADLDVIDRQLTVSQQEEARLRQLIAEYQQKVETVPKRESELVELTRDYDILKKTYDSLLTKREESKLSANLERRQIGEQFRILDPASLPAKAANQSTRLAFAVAPAAIGLAFGFLLTAFLEFRDSSFGHEADVARLLDLPVLALVPVMSSDTEKRRERVRKIVWDAAGVATVLGSLAVVAWGFLRT
jgi:polysaccharide chain length determinant protein (PEP-CTERM system associated)